MRELSPDDVSVLAKMNGLPIDETDLVEVTNRLNNFISGVEHLNYIELEGIDPVIFRPLEEC
jgi:Asp-tRNA(Asn)/Glu-tRNA(Gln) amidotransferase C subunit